MTRATFLTFLAAAAVLDACSCDRLPSTALTDCNQGAVVQGAVKTDILFVIDDSGSMLPHQTNLASNLSTFISTLKLSPVANDFQIGVTTTSVSDFTGTLTGEQGCFVGPILQGGSSNLVADFQAQVAAVGTGGSGKEQPLRAMKLALTTPSLAGCTRNAGFLRSGARLAVVILTDEDDNSDSANAILDPNGNDKTHNDVQTGGASAGQGVDYKGTVEDKIADYVTFLKGTIGGEVRNVVLGVIAGVDPTTKLPTTDYTVGNRWGCGSPVNNLCVANTAASIQVTNPLAAPHQQMDVWCLGTATGTCVSTCPNAYDKADRLTAFVAPGNFAPGKVVVGSICDASFANTLSQIAGLIVSPTVPLSGEPADPALLVVRIRKPDGSMVSCVSGVDYTYAPASGSSPATVTFLDSGVCKLDQGYKIDISVICAG
jgi:hypothetical protein